MTIKVNGKDILIEKAVTVKELLEIQKVEMPDYVTVQINDEILDKGDFETLTVKEGDVVEFLYFMGGGAL
ncbi:sulfur carrier protein ThiS [Acetivibrio mesophilus]|uniref:Sulfur carrier protein ThiS n=1 Tax=Acetivibrio mesophilus TaxID=2487273 RepID=A0A4Q0I1M0_9FIRM|nr:sulfur carrier protein ThiS [Acetivibrio mesophilus]ODM27272.1 thiamine biosynthesis protein ThiS [Clostridium sp. Bc-iso-3]RXE58031.1 sulfur carrier protein ThiS [Acetivibrio mesophilus]HHV29809.1 sulfur carrier protein ThiS [Clostridium sp.]